MKFVCTKENLNYALDVVSSLANKQSNLPILENILINATESKVEFISTNLEVAVRTHLRAKVEKTGSFTTPAKTFNDYVKLLTHEQIEIELKQNELSVVCGSSSTKIKGISSEEYPVIPNVEEDHAYAVSADSFKEALSRSVISAARNEIRPELSGVYLGFNTERHSGMIAAATDSYRLTEVRLETAQGDDKDVKCIVPIRVVYEMIRLIALGKSRSAEENIRAWVSDNQIALRYDEFELTSRLIEGTYPDYAQIIPESFKTTAVFEKEEIVNKIKAASIFTTTGVNAVSFDLNASQGTVGVSSTCTQTGEHTSEVEAVVQGEENSILLNHRYVLDGLQQINQKDIEFNVNDADSPCMFKAKDDNSFIYIVMPIRQ